MGMANVRYSNGLGGGSFACAKVCLKLAEDTGQAPGEQPAIGEIRKGADREQDDGQK
jgi:hypothetical protein